jgi:hypothetical protein
MGLQQKGLGNQAYSHFRIFGGKEMNVEKKNIKISILKKKIFFKEYSPPLIFQGDQQKYF